MVFFVGELEQRDRNCAALQLELGGIPPDSRGATVHTCAAAHQQESDGSGLQPCDATAAAALTDLASLRLENSVPEVELAILQCSSPSASGCVVGS